MQDKHLNPAHPQPDSSIVDALLLIHSDLQQLIALLQPSGAVALRILTGTPTEKP
jgi:hypothetical protein